MRSFDISKRVKGGQKVEIILRDNQYAVISQLANIHGVSVESYIVQMIKDGYQYYSVGERLLAKALRDGFIDGDSSLSWLYKLHSTITKNQEIDKNYISSLRQAYAMLRGEDKDEWVRVLKAIRNNCASETLDIYTDISVDGRHVHLGGCTDKPKNFLAQRTVNFETMQFNKVKEEKGEENNEEVI